MMVWQTSPWIALKPLLLQKNCLGLRRVPAAERAAAPALAQSPERFINRELSWLHFNRRVLEEAENLAPSAARAGAVPVDLGQQPRRILHGPRRRPEGQVRAGVTTRSPDGLTPPSSLRASREAVSALASDQQARWRELRRELADDGIVLVDGPEVTRKEKTWLEDHFLRQVFPLLTPLAIDPAHPFPFIPNLGFTIALQLARASDGQAMNALIRMPNKIERFVRLPNADGTAARVITIEQLTGLFIGQLFPGYALKGQGAFRVIRDCEIEIEEEAEDLVREFETVLKRRRRGSVIRLEIEAAMPAELRRFVQRALVLRRRRGVPGRRRAGAQRVVAAHEPRPAGPRIRALQSALPRAHPRARRRLLRGHPPEGPGRPPPLRILRRGGAVPAAGRARSGRRRHQADALPHLLGFADRQDAGRGGRGRQVGHRAGRAEGALRRGGQHPLVARARARRRPGGVRLHRAEDPRQAVAGRAPRGRGARHLRPCRHRQLPSGHRAHLYRPVVLHVRPGDRARRRARVQLRHRLRRAGRARANGGVAADAAQARRRAHRRRRSRTPRPASRRRSG